MKKSAKQYFERVTSDRTIIRPISRLIRKDMFAGGGGVGAVGGYGDKDFIDRLSKPPAERDSEVSAFFHF